VTEYIPEIQEMIDQILKHEFAYIGKESGSVYFDVSKYGSNYGIFRDSSIIKPNLVGM
jgi:cysteinyl-tRNA synthetase